MGKLPFPGIALATKRFPQSKARCGPAALKIVASYFGPMLVQRNLALQTVLMLEGVDHARLRRCRHGKASPMSLRIGKITNEGI
ncbi:MAG: hypothetical protein WBE90_16485 [Xanthobacteraceae bacterium]|jgi:hypothetical protein